jgi:transcriptional adapter 3
MPPYAGAKSKGGKARDGRRSRSRNTTPSSVISAPAVSGPATTPFLELDTSKLLINTASVYSDILEKLESKTSLDPKQFQDIISQLNSLGDGAEKRSDLCSAAMRTLHEQYGELEAEQKEKERQAEQTRKMKARQEARAAETAASQKNNGKPKKRKDRGEFEGVEIKREGEFIIIPSIWRQPCDKPTHALGSASTNHHLDVSHVQTRMRFSLQLYTH